MAWKPTKLTREQLEERRLAAGRLFKAGQLSQAEIARQFGVSRAAVSKWAKRYRAGGLRRLGRRKASGRPAKLSRRQKRRLLQLLQRGTLAAGFATDRWTLRRVQQLIQREFDVSYHPNYLNRLLRALDWSPQKPLPGAIERDEQQIAIWRAKEWPRIKKSAPESG